MGFLINYFRENSKKKQDRKDLSRLVRELTKSMDGWIKGFEDDGTPPNEEQCVELEDAKIAEILGEYVSQAPAAIGLVEMNEVTEEYNEKLQENLQGLKGDLFRRFSSEIDSLEDKALKVLKECLKELDKKEKELEKMLPVKEPVIQEEFDELVQDLTEYTESRYPEGVQGLDNYDDALPDDIPSWSQFQETVQAKVEEFKGKNVEAIADAREKTKANTRKAVEKQINDAIQATMLAVREDLSDDTFPYLTEDASVEFRNELISLAEEYGQSRLASS